MSESHSNPVISNNFIVISSNLLVSDVKNLIKKIKPQYIIIFRQDALFLKYVFLTDAVLAAISKNKPNDKTKMKDFLQLHEDDASDSIDNYAIGNWQKRYDEPILLTKKHKIINILDYPKPNKEYQIKGINFSYMLPSNHSVLENYSPELDNKIDSIQYNRANYGQPNMYIPSNWSYFKTC